MPSDTQQLDAIQPTGRRTARIRTKAAADREDGERFARILSSGGTPY